MSVAATTAPAAGWYPDPTEPDRHLRWWDGSTWTSYVTDVPQPEPEPEAPHPFANVVVDLAPDDDIPEAEPIDFSWSDPDDLFEVTVSEYETAPPVEPETFSFRARPLEPVEPEPIAIPSLPVYESPLDTISSPLNVRVEVPVRIEPAAPVVAPAPQREVVPPPPPPAAPTPGRRRIALAGTGVVVAVAAAAAIVTNVISGGDTRRAAAAAPALSDTDKACLRVWNTTASPSAAQLRVTLGQFEGALARVSQVAPLPGTVMAPNSCALTVYDPATDTHAVFVAGVRDQIGYMDVTSYPRAEQYGWPKAQRDANVGIRSDGSIRAL
jgi:hypothetical protein